MKTLTLTLGLSLFLAGAAQAQLGSALYPFHEYFEATTLAPWWSGGGDGMNPMALSSVQDPFAGQGHLHVGGISGEGTKQAWMQLEIDLADRTGILLDFMMRRQKAGVGSNEGLYLGPNEASLQLAWQLEGYSTSLDYDRFVLDLDQLVSDLSMELTDNFLIRYEWSGYSPGLGGGLFFDEFRVVPKGFEVLGAHSSQNPTGLGNFGASAASVGDLDGDGITEVAVGHPGYSLKRGRVELLDGATMAYVGTIQKGIFGERMGEAMAPVGDLDGDGHGELLVGAPSNDVGGIDRGAVYVVSPKKQAILEELAGSSAGDAFGTSVAGAGDLDGDGLDDYLVGALLPDGAGRVTVHSGGDQSLLLTLDGPDAGAGLGTSMAPGPDLDGDELPELYLGSPGWMAGTGERPGMVEAYSSATGLVVRSYPGLTDGSGWGTSLAVVPDLDGDGIDDLVVGAPDSHGGRGEVRAVSSATGQTLASYQGDLVDDHLGTSVQLVGNLDGLGTDDLALGARSDSVGSAVLVTLPDLEVLARTSLIQELTGFGTCFVGLGDRDGDGNGELLCTEPDFDGPAGQLAGQVRVIKPITTPSLVLLQGVHCTLAGEVLLKGSGLSLTSQVLVDGQPVPFVKASPVELLVPVVPEVPGGFHDLVVVVDQDPLEFPGGIARYPAVGMADTASLGQDVTVRFDNGSPGSYVVAFSNAVYGTPALFEAWGWYHGLELNGVWMFGAGVLTPGDTERFHTLTVPNNPFFIGESFHVQAWAWQADLDLIGFSNRATTQIVE